VRLTVQNKHGPSLGYWCGSGDHMTHDAKLANEVSLGEVVELITKHCTCPLFSNEDMLKLT